MEKVYRIESGDLINIGAKFDAFSSELCPSSISQLPQTYDDVKSLLDIQNETEEQLVDDSISLNNLDQPDDIPIFDVKLHEINTKQWRRRDIVEIPKKAMQLKCVRHRFDIDTSKCGPSALGKYNRNRYIEQKTSEADGKPDLIPFQDVLINVRVYEPFAYKRGENTNRKPRLSQEFLVLGRQKLTELRDKIYCYCRFGPFKDISDDFDGIQKTTLDEPEETFTCNTNEPGFFFITDTFYNDYRATSTDNSAEIREWMERQKDFDQMQVKSMDDTRFSDLNLRVGFPQLYRHNVDCEHVISFTDIRLLAPDDALKSSDYPMLRCISGTKMIICDICGVIEASFVIRKSSSHLQDPSFLCKKCFISFHYVNGKKVGNFQAFRYYGNRPIVN